MVVLFYILLHKYIIRWGAKIETNDKDGKEHEKEFVCKECGWNFPRELIDSLIKNGESIYCEKCGFENRKGDLLSPQIIKNVKLENAKGLWDILSTAKKKSLEYKKKIKAKIDELMEKSNND